ncbi:MAG: hypothetical protein ACWGQW_01970 [bacterium]
MNTTDFTCKVFRIFMMFVIRSGKLSPKQALEEALRMRETFSVLPSTSPKERLEAYKELVRKGASFPLTRRDKINLMLSLENAINHACFELDMTGKKLQD